MTTVLDKELKRQVNVDGSDYTVVLDPQGLRLMLKGRRKPEVALRWSDLVNGQAAMAIALNASLALPRSKAKAPASEIPLSLDKNRSDANKRSTTGRRR